MPMQRRLLERRQVLSFLLGIAAAAALLVLTMRRVDPSELVRSLSRVDLLILGMAIAVKVAVVALKALRWALSIGAGADRTPRKRVLAACWIGLAGNVLLPARMGEFLRAGVVTRHNGIPMAHVLTSSGITLLCDLGALALYFLGVSVWMAGTFDRTAAMGTVAIVLFILLVLTVGARAPGTSRRIAHALSRFAPTALRHPLQSGIQNVGSGLRVLAGSRALLALVGITALVWSLETLAVALGLSAFGVGVDPLMAAAMVTALNLSFALPLTPGNLGVHQLVSVLVLAAFGIERLDALTFSVGFQGASYSVFVILGALSLAREGVSTPTRPTAEEG